MSVNGCLAGLVAITAPCAFVTVQASLVIGLLAGILVVFAVKLLDALKIDDPVGAVPVHLFNGVFGTICVGLFAVDKITGAATGNGLFYGGGMTLLMAQLKGIGAVGVYTLRRLVDLLARHQVHDRPPRQRSRKKSKASTSASTARRRTSDLRRRVARAVEVGLDASLNQAGGARCAAGHLIWRTS